ncbi:hypothetical protein HK405_000295, partial [Cladochytrium tenue]
GEGPVFVVKALCNDGQVIANASDAVANGATDVSTVVISADERLFMLSTLIVMPIDSVIDDVTGDIPEVDPPDLPSPGFAQQCTTVAWAGAGVVTYSYTSDQWGQIGGGQVVAVSNQNQSVTLVQGKSASEFSNNFVNYVSDSAVGFDSYGVMPLIAEATITSLQNGSYYPSQGATFCNLLSWATYPDGYYHSSAMNRGILVAVGTAAHFSLRQFNTSQVGPCMYYGLNGSGMLQIPEIAVIAASIGSGVALTVKLFEILWWAMMALPPTAPGYRRAVRSLRHPLRFALDTAEMLRKLVIRSTAAGEADPCDSSLRATLGVFGNLRVQFGEDNDTVDADEGHLRIGEFGKIAAIRADRKYGSLPPPLNPELDDLTEP